MWDEDDNGLSKLQVVIREFVMDSSFHEMDKVEFLGTVIEHQSEARQSQFFNTTYHKMPLIQSSQDYLPCKNKCLID